MKNIPINLLSLINSSINSFLAMKYSDKYLKDIDIDYLKIRELKNNLESSIINEGILISEENLLNIINILKGTYKEMGSEYEIVSGNSLFDLNNLIIKLENL